MSESLQVAQFARPPSQNHLLQTTSFVTLENVYEKQTVGGDPGILFKQILEANLNASFDVYQSSHKGVSGKGTSLVEEISSGKAEYCLNFLLLPPGATWSTQVETIPSGFSLDMVFVVPMPKRIESWRLFQYIFQWQVSIGLVIALCLLSGAALLFQYFHSQLNTVSHRPGRLSAIVSVWKAALSVSMKRLPTTCSQRLLIALALLLGLIFLNLTSAQLFVLVKTKPRHSSKKTLQELHDSNLPIYAIHEHFSPYLNIFENTSLRNFKVNLRTDKMYENIYYFNPTFFNITDRALVYTNTIVELIKSLPRSRAFLQYSR